MGQNTSKQHDPLPFGYINRVDNQDPLEEQALDRENPSTDFILANPHLYKLEITCQNGCNGFLSNDGSSGSAAAAAKSRRDSIVVVATKVDQECEVCRQSKRLSLVRRDLAKDLAYIDETYYPDVIHYGSSDDMLHDELAAQQLGDDVDNYIADGSEDDDNNHWAKLTIGDVAPTRNRPLANASLAVDLSGRSLVKLSPSIGYLHNLTKLDLSHNQMTSLPRTIGHLRNLRILDTSHNQLETIPDTIAYMTKLTALNISHNQLVTLPTSIGLLPKLIVIIANDNRLTSLPREIAQLRGLISLNVSNNPLPWIPAEIGTLQSLRKLIAEGCEFVEEFEHELQHDPPSLFELCARAAVRTELPIPNHMADHIKEYLAQAQTCSFCDGPFFESYITRGRFIERSGRQVVALEYRLCSAHWNDESDRLKALFAPIPNTAPSRRIAAISNINKDLVNTDGLEPTLSSSSTSASLSTSPSSSYLLQSPRPRRALLGNRHRAYSDLSTRSRQRSTSPALSLSSSTSSQLSRRSNSSTSLAAALGSLPLSSSPSEMDVVSIRSLKRQPSLPALPVPVPTKSTTTCSSSSRPQQRQRPRAASSASVTRRITGLLSSSPSRSYSNSALRQQPWNASEHLEELHETTAEAESPDYTLSSSSSSSSPNTPPPPSLHPRTTSHGSSLQVEEASSSSNNNNIHASSTPVHMRTGVAKIPVTNGIRASLAHLGARFTTRDRSGTV